MCYKSHRTPLKTVKLAILKYRNFNLLTNLSQFIIQNLTPFHLQFQGNDTKVKCTPNHTISCNGFDKAEKPI